MSRSIATGAILLLGALLIALCSTGTLWFDEILSLQWARSAKSPWQLLELYRHDNNHPLNSLWLMAAGVDSAPWVLRLLSMGSGVVSLVLIHHLALRFSVRFAWIPLLLAATSYPLVLYFSEARGYAPAIACLLGAYATLTGSGRVAWRIPLFWALSLLAVLSHGTALVLLAAMGVSELLAGRGKPSARLGSIAVWFGVPFVAAAMHWHFFLRQMIIAGGPEYPLLVVLSHFFGYAFGIPGAGNGSSIVAVAGLVLLGVALGAGRFPDAASRWFFVGATVVFPALSLVATDTTYLYFRYFLVSLPFIYLLTAPLATRLAEFGRLPLTAALVLLAVCIGGQVPRLWTLSNQGRGDYLSALRWIVSDAAPDMSIISNNDMQVGLVLGHFRSEYPDLEPLRFLPRSTSGAAAPQWILYATQEDPPAPPEPVIELDGRHYTAVSKHLSAPVSGAHWTIYKIQPPSP
jgi:hypothetical protein